MIFKIKYNFVILELIGQPYNHDNIMAGYVNAVRALAALNSQPERQAVSVIFESCPLTILSQLFPL